MTKQEIRTQMLDKRKQLTPSQIDLLSSQIAESAIDSDEFLNAGTICVYLSAFNEVSTYEIISKALEMGKRLCAPVVDKYTKKMDMMEFVFFQDLVIGAYGILEPVAGKIIPPNEIDIIYVPAVAFSNDKHRIGYGGGYYDKFLPQMYPDAKKVGLAFDFQICNNFDVNEHDIAVDKIFTENRVIY